MNQKAIETCIALGAIKIDEYNKIEKKLIKYIYDADIDLRRLLKYFLDTKGLSFIKFTELSKFIIYNDYGEYLDLFYPVLDRFKLINKLDYGRYGFRELMSRLYKKKSIEDVPF